MPYINAYQPPKNDMQKYPKIYPLPSLSPIYNMQKYQKIYTLPSLSHDHSSGVTLIQISNPSPLDKRIKKKKAFFFRYN